MENLDTRAYVSILKDIVEEGHTASMTIVGSSMNPFLCHERDKITFSAPDGELKRGDMVFFQRENGAYVMHRICRVSEEGFYLVGDAQTEIEGPVRREQIFARVTQVERKGRKLTGKDFWWRFFAGPWLWVRPVRPGIVRVYSYLRK